MSVSERVIRLVRKLDAGNPPVQFDERGVETERQATAPLLDSTMDIYKEKAIFQV
jgi:hypothetical protein